MSFFSSICFSSPHLLSSSSNLVSSFLFPFREQNPSLIFSASSSVGRYPTFLSDSFLRSTFPPLLLSPWIMLKWVGADAYQPVYFHASSSESPRVHTSTISSRGYSHHKHSPPPFKSPEALRQLPSYLGRMKKLKRSLLTVAVSDTKAS
jgi:hypothetical protein